MARMRFTIGQRTNLYSAAMVVASVVAAGHLFFKADYLFAQNERLALIEVDASNTDRIETLLAESISETRAIYASPDTLSAAAHVEELNTRIDRVEALLRQWQSANGVADQGLFKALSERIASFNAQRRGLVELARNETPDAVRQLSDAPSSPVRTETEALAVAIRAMSGALHQQFEASSRQVGETITTIKWSVVAACVAWFAFAFGLALPFVQKSVARPIARVSRYMNELADGKTAMDIRTSERNDEVGDMWRSLVRLRGAIERNAELMHELKLRDDREADLMRQAAIRDQARDFHASLISATGRVSALLGEIGGSATKMNEAADFARSRGAEMTNSAQSAEQNIAIVSVSALQVSSSTREISERVEGVATAVRDTLDNAERSVAASADLDTAGKRIGDVVSLISDVAAQTNLLALNATIEAARAGAAGRGFAVVAAEVKALATQTSQATLEIGAQVKDMQAATRLSITAIDGIRTEIRTISEATSAISSAILEQNAAFMQIASTVKAAAEESRTMTMAAGVVGRAIQDTGVRADAMQSIAGALTEEIDRLSTHIAVFSETLSAA